MPTERYFSGDRERLRRSPIPIPTVRVQTGQTLERTVRSRCSNELRATREGVGRGCTVKRTGGGGREWYRCREVKVVRVLVINKAESRAAPTRKLGRDTRQNCRYGIACDISIPALNSLPEYRANLVWLIKPRVPSSIAMGSKFDSPQPRLTGCPEQLFSSVYSSRFFAQREAANIHKGNENGK